jgi:hypothetical protein
MLQNVLGAFGNPVPHRSQLGTAYCVAGTVCKGANLGPGNFPLTKNFCKPQKHVGGLSAMERSGPWTPDAPGHAQCIREPYAAQIAPEKHALRRWDGLQGRKSKISGPEMSHSPKISENPRNMLEA